MNLYALLADLVVILHLGYLCFTVGGEAAILLGALSGWSWIRNRIFRFLHLAAVLFVAFEALVGMWCPLTILEFRLRRMAGQGSGERISFVAKIVRRLLFWDLPAWSFTALYIGFGLLVFATLLFVPPQKKRPRR